MSKKKYQIFEVIIQDWVFYDPKFNKEYVYFFPISNIFLNNKVMDFITDLEFRLLIRLIQVAHRSRKGQVKVDERLYKGNGKLMERSLSKLESFQLLTFSKVNEVKEINKIKAGSKEPEVITGLNKDSKPKEVVQNKKSYEPEIIAAYELSYPRKEGKSVGVKKLSKEIKTKQDLDLFLLAVKNYSAKHISTEKKFIKHFSSFANEWRDHVEPEKQTTQKLCDKDPFSGIGGVS